MRPTEAHPLFYRLKRGQLTSLKNIEKYAEYYRYKKRKMVRRSLDLHSWHDQGSVACSAELAGSTLAEASADICPVEYHAGVGESYLDQWVHSEGIHAACVCGAGDTGVLALVSYVHGVVGVVGSSQFSW